MPASIDQPSTASQNVACVKMSAWLFLFLLKITVRRHHELVDCTGLDSGAGERGVFVAVRVGGERGGSLAPQPRGGVGEVSSSLLDTVVPSASVE